MAKRKPKAQPPSPVHANYDGLLSRIAQLLEQGRRSAVRSVNAILAATYWQIGRQIVEHEQGGKPQAEYGEEVVDRLARDLTARFGRGFSRRNVFQMKAFFLGWELGQTASRQLQARVRCSAPAAGADGEKVQTASAQLQTIDPTGLPSEIAAALVNAFPLPWSHYVRLMTVRDDFARAFYEEEAIRAAWSVRQLDRQIATQFFERTALSRNKEAMILKGRQQRPEDAVTLEEAIRDPYLLEFLNLKDEYSEGELEEAIIRHLQSFLLEMGDAFTFVARQRRIRIGNVWYFMDLVLYHRDLQCLVVITLKLGEFTHADAGQMNLYLNYAKEHMKRSWETDPVGLVLCSEKNDAVVHYAMGGIQARVFASRYLTVLPDPETLRREIQATRRALEARAGSRGTPPQ